MQTKYILAFLRRLLTKGHIKQDNFKKNFSVLNKDAFEFHF